MRREHNNETRVYGLLKWRCTEAVNNDTCVCLLNEGESSTVYAGASFNSNNVHVVYVVCVQIFEHPISFVKESVLNVYYEYRGYPFSPHQIRVFALRG